MSTSVPQYTSRQPRAAFQIGNAQIPISRLTLTHTIDELPYAQVLVQLDNANAGDSLTNRLGSVGIDINQFSILSRVTQEKILNEYNVDPDTQLIIDDGDGNQTLMKGFLGQPQFRMRDGEVFLAFSLVHAMAVLQSMNLRIYGDQKYYGLTGLLQMFDFDDASRAVLAGFSIADRVQILINGMMRTTNFYKTNLDLGQYDGLPIDNLNREVLSKVTAFLSASSATTIINGIGDSGDFTTGTFDNTNLLNTIFVILNESPNFLQALGPLCETFMLQMNADYQGSAWLEWNQVNTSPTVKKYSLSPTPTTITRTISVPLKQVSFNMANIFQVPILQAIVQGAGSDLYAFSSYFGVKQGTSAILPGRSDASAAINAGVAATGDYSLRLTASALWPQVIPRNSIGTFYMLDAPNWLNPDLVSLEESILFESVSADTDTYEVAVDAYKRYEAKMEGAAAVRERIMQYMAKQQFRSLYLGGTTGQIAIPMNLAVKPGYTYMVKSITGEDLFTGYLVSVVHDLMVDPEGNGSATTSLAFSHITAPGAVINVLQDKISFPKASVTPAPVFVGDVVIDNSTNSIA